MSVAGSGTMESATAWKFMGKPQSWVYNCETANRRVDLAEFVAWCEACGIKPQDGLRRFLKA